MKPVLVTGALGSGGPDSGGPDSGGLRLAVFGEAVGGEAARLAGGAAGWLMRLDAAAEARLSHYAVATGAIWRDGVTEAGLAVRVLEGGEGAGPEAVALAREIMALQGLVAPERLRGRLGSLAVTAASRVRAEAAAPRGLRTGSGQVEQVDRDVPHAGFFALEVHALRYRQFDGQMSGRLVREMFVAGDAVTVLPYDPARDRVLLIEQVRMGPYGRGDPMPWQLEAIAGRIDPGETPEDCARREAVEEAGLRLGALEKVAEYYPSPGALTEYLYSYVALCDLPDGVAGVFGLAEEAEDIRGHLVTFDALMMLVAGGEVANAPLLLTALWLQRERERLRG